MGQITVARKHVQTVPQALRALAAMERQLDAAKTYETIKRVMKSAEALKILMGEVAEVKQQAELVILVANQRIDQEIKKIPKASGRPKKSSQSATNKPSRGDSGIPKWSRSRLGKLGALSKSKLKAIAEDLWRRGKDATMRAVVSELKEGEIKDSRTQFEARRDKGANVGDLVAMAEAGLRFPVIYADPPWEFKVYSGKGKQRSAERYYDTASLDAIKALPIGQLAAENAYLFLWGVWPKIPGALDVIKAWGFEYKTTGFVWVKSTPNAQSIAIDGAGLHWGMGYHTRANTEFCLLATKGSPQRTGKDVHQVVIAPALEHSQKPEEVRQRIEQLAIGPYLELFARRAVPGWTVWGNEIAATETEIAEAAE